MRNREEYLRNKKYKCKGFEVEDFGVNEELKKSYCGWSRGIKRVNGGDEVKEVLYVLGF